MAVQLPLTRYTGAVWTRHYLVWRRLFWSSMATNVANPILFLFAFGFGLGRMIEKVGEVPYLAFVVPGMAAYAAMFAASFEMTIVTFSRFKIQRTWDAVLATPVTLRELMFGEVLWAVSKAMIGCICVLAVGLAWGGVPQPAGLVPAILALAIASFTFAACGIWFTSMVKDWEYFSYFFTFWITPMFVFSGVFFAIDRFPAWLQPIAWLLPATHLIELIRPMTTGLALDPLWALVHLAYLVGLGLAAFELAVRNMTRRLIN